MNWAGERKLMPKDPVEKKGKNRKPPVTVDMIRDDGTVEGDADFDFFLSEDEDAMGRLGYGVVSYFGLIYTMLIIYFLLTVGHIPMMYNYASWKAYEGEKQLSVTT